MADSTKPSTPKTADDKVAEAAATKTPAPEAAAPEKDAEKGGLKADPGPVTDALAGHAPLPDPSEQRDEVRNVDDAQAASALKAEADPDVNTDNAHFAYQISQFDGSGVNVLDSLAFPPKAAVRAQEVAKAQLGNTDLVTDGTDVSTPVTREDDHDLKEASVDDVTKTPTDEPKAVVGGTNQEQVVRSDGSKTTDTK